MAPVTTLEPKTVPAFPAGEIEACIRDVLADQGAMQVALQGGATPAGDPGSAVGPQPVIDSLVVVEVLLAIEPKVPFALPDSLVQPGGYDNVDEVVQHLVPQLERRWRKHHEEKN